MFCFAREFFDSISNWFDRVKMARGKPRSPNSTAMLALLRQYHMDEDDLVRACLPSRRPTSRPCSCAPVCPPE